VLDAGRKGLNVNRVFASDFWGSVFCSFNDAVSTAHRDGKEIVHIRSSQLLMKEVATNKRAGRVDSRYFTIISG
jgi:hypothetical protein